MIKETVQAVGVTHIVTESGSKTLLGNREFEIGDSVWTHGNYAFGTERNYPMPIILPPATETGEYIVEWTGYNGSTFRIRSLTDFSYDAVVATDLVDGYYLAYNQSGTKFTLVSWSYDGGFSVTLKNVLDGTSETINVLTSDDFDAQIPSAYYDNDDKLRWIVFAREYNDEQATDTEGIIISPAFNSIKIYEYQDAELINTVDYLAIRDDLIAEAKTILYDSSNLSIADTTLYTYAVESHNFQITLGASAAGDVIVNIDGASYPITVTTTMTNAEIATAIANGSYSNGWAGSVTGATATLERLVSSFGGHADATVSLNAGSTGIAYTAIGPAHPNGIEQTYTYETVDKPCSMNYPQQLTPELKNLWGKEVYLGFSDSSSFSFVANLVTTTDGTAVKNTGYFGSGQFAYEVSVKDADTTAIVKRFIASASSSTYTFGDMFVNSSAPYTTKNIIHNITISTAALDIDIDTKDAYEATQIKTLPNGFAVLWDKTAGTLTLSAAGWSMDISEMVSEISLDKIYIVESFNNTNVLLITDKGLHIIDRTTSTISKSVTGLYFNNFNAPVIQTDKNKIISKIKGRQ